jgi:hypothetical protein
MPVDDAVSLIGRSFDAYQLAKILTTNTVYI